MFTNMYSTAIPINAAGPANLIVLIGFLTSLTMLNALAYPSYAKLILTRALTRPWASFVDPSKAFRKLAPGSGMDFIPPPRTTNPVMLMLYRACYYINLSHIRGLITRSMWELWEFQYHLRGRVNIYWKWCRLFQKSSAQINDMISFRTYILWLRCIQQWQRL